jgi:hypothetical protein
MKVAKKRGRPPKAKVIVPEVYETATAQVAEKVNVPSSPMNVDAGSLIQRAIDKGVTLEQMDRLLAMRRELKAEWAREQFFAALSSFQRECPVIGKTSAVDFTNKKGGRTHYKYASLDQIVTQVKEALERWGFSYVIKSEQNVDQVRSICIAHHRDGHQEETSFAIPIDHEAYMNEAQKVASALTYSKRYAFCNAFGIMTGDEDDDAQATNGNTHKEPVFDISHAAEATVVEPTAEIWNEVGKPPQSYWAKKGNKYAQQTALCEAFGPGNYKVEKAEDGTWKTYKAVDPVMSDADKSAAQEAFERTL